ncbi:MAG: hypothetical protein LIO79_08610 [Rikenellaceae bacterium]|nr:hypothetical protein [Rikenellaceae bacterium]
MNVITNIIFNLLSAHKSVSLPEIGTLKFVQEKIENNGIFLLKNRVVFEEEIDPDLNIIERIHNQSEIPIKDIIYNYKKWLEEVKTDEGVFIPKVGKIIINNGVSKFEPEREFDSILNQEFSVNTDISKNNEITENEVEANKTVSSSNNGSAKKLIIAALLLAAFGIGGYYYININNRSQNDSSVITVTEKTNMEITVDNSNTDTLKVETVVSNSLSPIKNLPLYHVIGGVFTIKENAERFVEQMGGKSYYDPIILPHSNNRYMVSLIRFSDRDEAVKEIRKTPSEYREIWIYEEK